MSLPTNQTYRSRQEERARVVVLMPKEETHAIDTWAVPAGMTSRTAAIRFLVRKGLESVMGENHRQ